MTEANLPAPAQTADPQLPAASTNPAGRIALQAGLLRAPLAHPLLLGFCVGAGAAWLLGDTQRRNHLIRRGLKLYDSLLGGLDELKEEVADLRAELDAERHGDR
ncbi:hypothetical protein D3C80_1833670 [compost metagenome]